MNRQRLDSPLVYIGAHNVYYVKLIMKVLYFTIHIHTQINQYVVISGEVLVLDGATFSAKTDLIDGTNILPFQARYIALGQSVAGTANADATFKVQYL